MEQINHANGEAAAMVAVAQAKARGLDIVSESLKLQEGKNAASLFIAEEYVHAFNKLARTSNTLILPSNVGDVTSLVGQAMSIYSTVAKHTAQTQGNSGGGATEARSSAPDVSALLERSILERPVASENVVFVAGSEGGKNESVRRKDATLLANEHSDSIKFDKNAP